MATLRRRAHTSTDYVHPHHPLPVRAFNAIGRTAGQLGWSSEPLVDTLIRDATRKTGLTDFGHDGHARALEVLVDSINGEADLTPTGKLIQRSRLTSALIQRLRIEQLFKQHPEIHDLDLGSVILITGLQRTGTTFLHRLLYSNPEIRGVTSAEALEPVPAGRGMTPGYAVRTTRAMLAQRLIAYLSPQFNMVHPVDHREPEEDVMFLDLSFMSQAPEAMMHVPAYSRWLEEQDHTPTYEHFSRVLKILCWQHPGRTWVLKTPHHMEYLDVFLKCFPAALIVQTHRDPRKALPSFCSMVAHGRGMFSDAVDPLEIARHWSRKTQRMVALSMQTRDKLDPDQSMDVSYYDLIEDPIAQLRRIYERADISFGDAAAGIAEQYARAHPQNRFGTHTYRLADFELDAETVDKNFSSYRRRYSIPFE